MVWFIPWDEPTTIHTPSQTPAIYSYYLCIILFATTKFTFLSIWHCSTDSIQLFFSLPANQFLTLSLSLSPCFCVLFFTLGSPLRLHSTLHRCFKIGRFRSFSGHHFNSLLICFNIHGGVGYNFNRPLEFVLTVRMTITLIVTYMIFSSYLLKILWWFFSNCVSIDFTPERSKKFLLDPLPCGGDC